MNPHEWSDRASIVVHVAILEAACHAGSRGFESRRSRLSKCLQMGTSWSLISASHELAVSMRVALRKLGQDLKRANTAQMN